MAISSSISDEMKRTPPPSGGELVDDRIDLVLGADVDAARRLVHDEDRRLGQQPLREDDLLLVAARQALGRLLAIGAGLDPSMLGDLPWRAEADAPGR